MGVMVTQSNEKKIFSGPGYLHQISVLIHVISNKTKQKTEKMKKVLVVLALGFLASCANENKEAKVEEAVATVDSTVTAVVDSAKVAVDSAAAKLDSAATKIVDSAKAKVVDAVKK
jgi:uncharacterized lipoprotein YajG